MYKKEVKEWKKVFEADYEYVVNEIKSDIEIPSIIFLEGEVGAGKTSMAKFFTNEQTSSPTYSLVNEYDYIAHADFYRLKDTSELYDIDLQSILEDKELFLCEWGSKYFYSLQSFVPENFSYYLLEINHKSDDAKAARDLSFYKVDPLLS